MAKKKRRKEIKVFSYISDTCAQSTKDVLLEEKIKKKSKQTEKKHLVATGKIVKTPPLENVVFNLTKVGRKNLSILFLQVVIDFRVTGVHKGKHVVSKYNIDKKR